jgi:hypothetical protein
MSGDELSKAQKAELRRASRDAVRDAFGRLRPHLAHDRWIAASNRYRQRTTEKLKQDIKASPASIKHEDLARYIAASALLHCADGWSFLGRSLDSHARADSDSARHLAYYAELRASMSILATEGIGIFDRHHLVVDASGRCRILQGAQRGTHVMAWLALQHWASLQRSAEILMSVIRPSGIALEDWVNAFRTPGAWGQVAREWFTTWGIDLRYLGRDRDARNEASYRPTGLRPMECIDVLSASSFVRTLWESYEPSSQSPFDALDRHLLRLGLARVFEITTGNSPRSLPPDYTRDLSAMLTAMGLEASYEEVWRSFLTWSTDPDEPLVVAEARQRADIANPRHHVQVISRACLLLRIATGMCSLMLRASGLSLDDMTFWWHALGESRGLWEPDNQPDDLADLCADIEVAVELLQRWENSKGDTRPSYASWWEEQARAISTLSTCERIVLWGLSP